MSFAAGGALILSYTNGTDRWNLRLPVAPFDPSSLYYTGDGPKVPEETGLASTFAAFGSVWAPYFDAAWSLSLEAIFHRDGDNADRLAPLPSWVTILGTSSELTATNPAIRRGFSFRSALGNMQRVRFFGIATPGVGAGRTCTANSGGFDVRDQEVVNYLSGTATGLVCWDGQPYPPSARVYERFLLRPFDRTGPPGPPGPPGPTGGGGMVDGCVSFPLGAQLCNPSADLVTLVTPTGTHQWDATGYTLPGGHRLEVI